MLLPSSGLGSKGPARGTVDVTHAKKKKKKKKRHCKKGYVLKRVIRGKGKHRHYVMRGKGKHRHYVRRCRKVKKKKALVPPPGVNPVGPTQTGFIVGMASGPAPAWEAQVMPSLRPRVVRFSISIDASLSDIGGAVSGMAKYGTEVIPVVMFNGRIPTTAEAQNLASWAHAYGPGGTYWQGRSNGYLAMRYIEFGNETNQEWQYGCGAGCAGFVPRAQQYALRARDAINAINGPGGNPNTKLLLAADDGGCGCSDWIDGMFSAVPNLNTLVGGWTSHPYGPPSVYREMLDRLVSDTARHGDTSDPIIVTEYGISTDNGRCLSDNYGWPKCLTYAQAATDMHNAIADMHSRYGRRLAMLMIFAQRDNAASGAESDREGYFGAFQNNFQPKGAFTTEVLNELAAYRG